jgi:hypothetical protein
MTTTTQKTRTKNSRTKKSRSAPLQWNYYDDLVPRAGLPDADRMAKRQKWLRRYVKSSVYLLPFVLVLSMFVALSNVHPRTTTTASNASASSSPGRTVATLAMEQWLAGTPSPLPHATIQSWDGANYIVPAPVKVSTGQTAPVRWTAELDTFTLIVGSSSTATVYSAVIEVALKPGGGAVALGGPSLTIMPATNTSSGWATGAPWSGISSSVTVTAPVQSAIDGWLAAFTSGSGSQLRLAIGDTSSSVYYVAMSGIASATDTAVAAATRAAPNQAPTATSTNHSAEIVEVTVSLLWKGEKAPAFGSSTSGPQTTMDLLLERADTAAPVVVAWGPPGSGPGLVPYQNAVRY